MNLIEMRTLVRKDLHDEDNSNYRWTDDELDRHISHALRDFSESIPLDQKTTTATVNGSREVSISSLTNRVIIEAIEFPAGRFPPCYQRFVIWNDILTLLGLEVPDGTGCKIYYGKLHTLDSGSSTIPAQYEDLVGAGACGYAAVQLAGYTIDQVNTGGPDTPEDRSVWGQEKLAYFRSELKRLGKRNRVRNRQLYTPYDRPVAKSTDWGP
jgi:hypothetical protein